MRISNPADSTQRANIITHRHSHRHRLSVIPLFLLRRHQLDVARCRDPPPLPSNPEMQRGSLEGKEKE